jgi:PAS domain S-box-containing protein
MPQTPDFAAHFRTAPYPFLLIGTDLVLLDANEAYLHATGRRAGELIGWHIFDAFPQNPSDPDSTNLREVQRSIELAIASREPVTSPLLRYSVPRETADGTVFEDRYWSAVHTPVLDGNGDVACVSQSPMDVTDLCRVDSESRLFFLKPGANTVPDVADASRPQMHAAMTRILNIERNELQMLFNQAPGFIAVLTGPGHVFELVNQAYYQLVGHRDLIGKPALDALPEMHGQGFKETLDRVLETGEPLVSKARQVLVQRESGGPLTELYIDLLYQPIFDTSGQATGIFVQGNDITSGHLANRALEQQVEELADARARQAFQLALSDRIRGLSSPDEIIDAANALLGERLHASRVLYLVVDDDAGTAFVRRDWTAPDLESLAGQRFVIGDYDPALLDELRAGRPVVRRDIALESRTAASAEHHERLVVAAKIMVPLIKSGVLEVILALQSREPRDWSDDEIEAVRDVAERTWLAVEAARTQDELRAQRDLSQSVFDSMAEGFQLLRRDWTIEYVNDVGLRLAQRSAEQIIGRHQWEAIPETAGSAVEAMYRQAFESGEPGSVEYFYQPASGVARWLEVRAYPIHGERLAVFFRDISARKQADEEIRDANRRKDEFLAMLAHELRNPLAPIRAAADLLSMPGADEARVRATSAIISRQVGHLTSLVDDLLDVSRVTRGLVVLEMEHVDMKRVVGEAVEQARPLVEARRHGLTVDLPPEAAHVAGDRKRLVQVLSNLLNNAAKYTPEGGRIRVAMDVEPAHVLIAVADDGIGMSADMTSRAFALFAQAERTSDRTQGGLGIGLALVRNLVELHGGTVLAKSGGSGAGSEFTIRLPRRHAASLPSPNTHEAGAGASATSLRVLVVDDNQDAANMLALLLEASGHTALVEYDSRQGLARARAEQPDACLLDIGLPGMDGNELARRLRADPRTARAVLIAVTGYGQALDRRNTHEAGFDHHLVKPLDPAELTALLAAIRPDA